MTLLHCAGRLSILLSITNVSTLHSYMSQTASRFNHLLWSSSVGVIQCFLNKSFSSLFCMTWNLLVFWMEHLPYTSKPYVILEHINAKYTYLASLLVTRYFTLLKIPKYFTSHLLKKFTCSLITPHIVFLRCDYLSLPWFRCILVPFA